MLLAFRHSLSLLIFSLGLITPVLGQSQATSAASLPCGGKIDDRRMPPQEVINYWQKCLTIFEERADKNGQAQAMQAMAVVHDAERRHELALQLYEKSLPLS